jgi:acetolactate synthase-1/2/3 large subunit
MVEKTAEFAKAFDEAVKSGKPAIHHLKVDPEALTTSTTIAKVRAAALAKQGH